MSAAGRGSNSDEPFFWWGPGWDRSQPRTLRELLIGETIDVWTAAQVWCGLSRRRSLVVIAGPSGSGKTTLLTALLEMLPVDTRRIYVRGSYETFSFLDDPTIDPRRTALLVNELSPHLPVYLWGPGVERLLRAGQQGYMLLATAHAHSAIEFVASLAGSPLRIAPELIARFEDVVALDSADRSGGSCRVTGLWRLVARRGGVELAAPPTRDISQQLNSASATWQAPDEPWFPRAEVEHRIDLLESYRDGAISALPMVAVSYGGPSG